VAVPFTRVAVPSVVAPEVNVTSPVGVNPVTVAVKVSCCFSLEVLAETERTVLDPARVGATGLGLVWLSKGITAPEEKLR
jgi:hypothetical protein